MPPQGQAGCFDAVRIEQVDIEAVIRRGKVSSEHIERDGCLVKIGAAGDGGFKAAETCVGGEVEYLVGADTTGLADAQRGS